MASLVYLNLIASGQRTAFANKVQVVSRQLGIDPNWLLAVMKMESGLQPGIINPNGGASGLIQFMPDTAKRLGTTIEAIRKMSAVEQLDYVYKFFKPYTGKLKSYYDVYAVTFFPLIVGKPDEWIVQAKGISAKSVAKANPRLDVNKDGKVTVSDFKKYVASTIPSEYKELILGGSDEIVNVAGIMF